MGLEETVLRAVAQSIRSPSAEELGRIARSDSELLTPDADRLLAKLQIDFQRHFGLAPGTEAGPVVELRRFLLRCRTIGVSAAVAEANEFHSIPKQLYELFEAAAFPNEPCGAPGLCRLWEACIRNAGFAAAPAQFKRLILHNSAVACIEAFKDTSDGSLLTEAESRLQAALASSSDEPERGMLLSTLGVCRTEQYQVLGDANLLAAAAKNHEEAVALTPHYSPRRAQHFKAQVQTEKAIFNATADLSALKSALNAQRGLLASLPAAPLPDSSRAYSEHIDLAEMLMKAFELARSAGDLEEASRIIEVVIAEGKADSDQLAALLLLRARALWMRHQYVCTASTGSLRAASRDLHELSQACASEMLRFCCFMELGNVLKALVDLGDHDASTKWESTALKALELVTVNDDRANGLNNYANALWARFSFTRDTSCLESAVEAARAASHIDASNEISGEVFTTLGCVLHERFNRFGGELDLEEAAEAFQEALRRASPSSHTLAKSLGNVGVIERERYDLYKKVEHLHLAIAAHERAADLSAATEFAALQRHNLGFCLRQLFEQTTALYSSRFPLRSPGKHRVDDSQLAVLRRSIEEHQRAIKMCSADSKQLSLFKGNLGSALLDLFYVTNDLDALESAVQAREEALNSLPEASPDRVGAEHQFASSLVSRYDAFDDPADRDAAVEHFRSACSLGLDVHLEECIVAADNWMHWSFIHARWDETCEAYSYVAAAVRRIVQQQASRSGKEVRLLSTQKLAAMAAYALLKRGLERDAAVVLEQHRARFLSEALQINRVFFADPETEQVRLLFSRLSECVMRLESMVDTRGPGRSSLSPAGIRMARDQLDEAIRAIQALPGYELFLRDPEWADIADAAKQRSAIVYIGATYHGGYAIVINSDSSLESLWLPDIGEAQLNERLSCVSGGKEVNYFELYRRWQGGDSDSGELWLEALERVTRWLWDAVVEPILVKVDSDASLVLVPSGVMSLLPLHAAWTEDERRVTGRVYALDVRPIHYAANARAFLAATASAANSSTASFLGVVDPDGPGKRPLKFARYEIESGAVTFERHKQLVGGAADRESVMDKLPHFDVVHFACHGSANWDRPLDSCLVLANGSVLRVNDLLSLRLRGPRLAVLSACESGVFDSRLPDEVIGLPTAFSQAGFSGVIASLWAVDDEHTALLMCRFYSEWRIRRGDPAEALRQAQIWLRDSKHSEKIEFVSGVADASAEQPLLSNWAAEFKRRPSLDTREPHPVFWAGFALTGG